MSDGCCCGATKSNACICMKKGITKCSKSEPKCPCYAEKDKKSFEKAWSLVKMPRTLEHLKLYESGKCPSCEGTGQQMVTVGSGDTSQSQSIDEAREMAMRDVEYSMMECVACGGTGVPDDEIWGDEGIMEYEDYE